MRRHASGAWYPRGPLLWRRGHGSATIVPMEELDWYYDDLKQVGTDFADAGGVATYDKRQVDDDYLVVRPS